MPLAKGKEAGAMRLLHHFYSTIEVRPFASSACSVLDINDYNGYLNDSSGGHSHGKEWASAGVPILLGYNYRAPGDAGGATTRIITAWKASRSSGDVDSWIDANKANKAWNACAIEKDAKYVFFRKQLFGRHKIEVVKKEDW